MSRVFLYYVLVPALLPVFLIFRYIYKLDKVEREPINFVLKVLMWGAILSLPCIPVETLAENLIASIYDQQSIAFAIREYFFGVALVEELSKWLVLWIFVWKNPNFDWSFDGIVYAATASLGFAGLENVMYVLSYGSAVSISRAIFSIPGHTAFGIFMGYFFSRSKAASIKGDGFLSFIMMIFALTVPTAIHGMYDFMLSEQVAETIFPALFIGYVIVLDIITWKILHKESKQDKFILN